MTRYKIVYSLAPIDSLDIYLPTAYLCELNKDDLPIYQRALAIEATLSSYDIVLHKEEDISLLRLCTELSITELEDNFNKKAKKRTSLQALFNDEKVSKTIKTQVELKLNRFYQLAKDTKAFLCFDLQRKISASDIQIVFFDGVAKPNMSFTKTQTGINYDLTLQIGDESVKLHKQNLIKLVDMPGIILLQKHIIFLETINANKLSPFVKNESVFIPKVTVKKYFETFILDLAAKVDDIDVNGFDLIKYSTLTKVEFDPFFDIFNQRWALRIRYHYTEFKFFHGETASKKTRLNIENEEIGVHQALRDKNAEGARIQYFIDKGWHLSDNGHLYFGNGKSETISGIANDPGAFTDPIYSLLPIIDNDRIIKPVPMMVREHILLINDWFDIQGTVRIENEDYPFSLIIPYIKSKNPYFKCADDTYVLIPDEIMETFGPISQHIVWVEDKPRLAKMYHSLVESLHVDFQGHSDTLFSSDTIEYNPSTFLKAELRPYQLSGVKWLIAHRLNGLGACLADDMGLGKTLQTIAALLHAKEAMPDEDLDGSFGRQLDLFSAPVMHHRKSLSSLILLPASLVFNWESEIKKYAPSLQVVRYLGGQRTEIRKILLTFDVILTTYQTALNDISWLEKQHFHYIVLDESQYIRNRGAKIFKAVSQLKSDHKVSLSGTPIENSLADLWSQMEFINPMILGKYEDFKSNFELPIIRSEGESQLETLKTIIEPYILRRTKGQVAKDLPDLIENVHFSDMDVDQAKLYEAEKSKARNLILQLDTENTETSRMHILSSIMRLRQIASHPKLHNQSYDGDSGKFDDITHKIEEIHRSGNKVLIFSAFVQHLLLIGEWMKEQSISYNILTGESTSKERETAVLSFESNASISVFLISIKAGGTGLNLTSAGYVFILDPWWNPQVEAQAIARAHRIGQTQNVIVTRFISRMSIDEKIIKLQASKRHLADSILEMEDLNHLTMKDIKDLIE